MSRKVFHLRMRSNGKASTKAEGKEEREGIRAHLDLRLPVILRVLRLSNLHPHQFIHLYLQSLSKFIRQRQDPMLLDQAGENDEGRKRKKVSSSPTIPPSIFLRRYPQLSRAYLLNSVSTSSHSFLRPPPWLSDRTVLLTRALI